MICFGLHSMRLSWSHDSGNMFGRLTRVVFCVFFLIFVFHPLILS
jgi:hypothetical protein